MKKPFAVLMTQILLVLVTIPAAVGALITISSIPGALANGASAVRVILGVVMAVAIVAALGFSFMAIRKQHSLGRGISIGVVVLIWGLLLYRMHNPSPTGHQLSPEELRGAGFAQLLTHVAMLSLLVSLVFSKGVRMYFARTEGVGPNNAFNTDAQNPRAG